MGVGRAAVCVALWGSVCAGLVAPVLGDEGYVLTLDKGERQCVVESLNPEAGGSAPGEDIDVDVVDLSGFGEIAAELEVRVAGGGRVRTGVVGVEVWRIVPPGGDPGPGGVPPVPTPGGQTKVLAFSDGMAPSAAVSETSWRGVEHLGSTQYEVCLYNRASGRAKTDVTVMWNVVAELADEERVTEEVGGVKDGKGEGRKEGEREEGVVDPVPHASEGERNPDSGERKMSAKLESDKRRRAGKVVGLEDVADTERSVRKVSGEAAKLSHAVRLHKIEQRTHELRIRDGNRLLGAMSMMELVVVVGIGLLQTFIITSKFKKRGALRSLGESSLGSTSSPSGKSISFVDMIAVTLGIKSHNAFLPHQGGGAGPPPPPQQGFTPGSYTQGRAF